MVENQLGESPEAGPRKLRLDEMQRSRSAANRAFVQNTAIPADAMMETSKSTDDEVDDYFPFLALFLL